MKINVIICLNVLCSLCPLAFGAPEPEAKADPDLIIQVKQIVGSSDNGRGLSDDGAAGEESADEGPAVTETPTEEGYTTEEPPIECPATWEATGGGCYKFLTDDLVDRSTAEDTCNAYDGAKLAVLDTEEKRATVYDYLVANGWNDSGPGGSWFHVGARKAGDKYLWDGTTFEVEGWSVTKNQPNANRGECVMASTDNYSAEPGKYDIFDVWPCSLGNYVLCEK